MRKIGLLLALVAAAAGCAMAGRDDIGGKDLDQNIDAAESRIKEIRTLSALAKLETSVSDYYKAENRIPQKLDLLIPRYLAEIPTVELTARGHKDTSEIYYYPSDVMRDGQIDGTKLKDTGKWGYTFNERQVIVFVDCTHVMGRGIPWYQARGVF